jgi:CHAT domain
VQTLLKTTIALAATELIDTDKCSHANLVLFGSHPAKITMSQLGANPPAGASLSDALRDFERIINNLNNYIDANEVDKCNFLHERGCSLREIFLAQNEEKALELAIRCLQQAVEETASDNPALAERRLDLALLYGDRFELKGNPEDINQAIELGHLVLKDVRETNPACSVVLAFLSAQLGNKFVYDKDADLTWAQESIRLGKQALDYPDIHQNQRAEWLHNLSATFGDLFSRTGDQEDIEEAINFQQLALGFVSKASPEWAIGLYDLAICFRQRYARLQQLQDLQQAITALESARESGLIRAISSQVSLVHHMSGCLTERFLRTQNSQDLEMAIRLTDSIRTLNNVRISDQATLYDDLCIARRYLFSKTKVLNDINQAINDGQTALAKARAAHQPELSHLHNLSLCYATRSAVDPATKKSDIGEAIRLGEQALSIGPDDHPRIGECPQSLGLQYQFKSEITQSEIDLKNSVSFAIRALRHETTTPLTRLIAGLSAASRLAILSRWTEASAIFEESFRLLPAISPRTSSRQDLQECLRRLPNSASVAASTFLKAGRSTTDALQVLEKGRGIISSYVIDSHSNVPFLEKDGDLYRRYANLQDILALPIRSDEPDDGHHSAQRYALELLRRSKAATDLDEIIQGKRQKSGVSFLRDSLEENDILHLALNYPIVYVNVSSVSSEAFLLTGDKIDCLSLPGLTRGVLEDTLSLLSETEDRNLRDGKVLWASGSSTTKVSTDIQSTMLTLWKEAVEPILAALQFMDEKSVFQTGFLPRLCWIGSEAAAKLPFHAAGDHSPESTKNTISHVVSSYATTLKSLQYARSKPTIPNPQTLLTKKQNYQKLLIAAMPTTPGIEGRLAVEDEVAAIIQSVAVQGHPATVIIQPSKQDIVASLPDCTIYHFAGHGRADAVDPAQSVLCLGRGSPEELSVRDLDAQRHPAAQIAYLSACSTAEAANRQLMDENIHLAGAFALAGFPSVVATLWKANDTAAVKVAGEFYRLMGTQKMLMRGESVARALHEALLSLRNSDETRAGLWKWAPFIHIGD